MSISEDKYAKRRNRTAAITTVISISLVLFMLGLISLMVLNANKMSNYVKENIGFSIYLKDKIKEVDIIQLQKSLDAEAFVKSTRYIDKEEAKKIFQEVYKEDFTDFIEYNPLLASIDIRLNADYANQDSIMGIEHRLKQNPLIKEVDYQKDLIVIVNENVKKISLFILAFAGLLLLISIALINNTIRLSIFSKRFLIKTMQLVGATSGFIRRPFVLQGIVQGLISSLIAIGLLIGVISFAKKEAPEIIETQIDLLVILFLLVSLIGVFISWTSTSLAVRKYLRLKTDDLY